MSDHAQEHWDLIIKPKSLILEFKVKELWMNRDLVLMFVKRDFSTVYKQTILGPLWFFIQPILTTLMFTVVFGNIAKIPTDGIPRTLFYLSGITLWNYFSDCLISTSDTFIKNANIFGKVYFPRLVVPISVVISNLLKFGVQMILFLVVYMYYAWSGFNIHPNSTLLLLPVLIIIMGILGLGLGMIISALTTKYRDLRFLITFGVQLLMYATPIIYPLSTISPKRRWIMELNPMTAIIETFKYSFLGKGSYLPEALVKSCIVSIVFLLAGILIFNKVEKKFMDNV
ncbi:MAG: ABC transporter permease [Taibaiella sp.]|nr:ABC transporter permease [Taibaiella sp.]